MSVLRREAIVSESYGVVYGYALIGLADRMRVPAVSNCHTRQAVNAERRSKVQATPSATLSTMKPESISTEPSARAASFCGAAVLVLLKAVDAGHVELEDTM